MTRRSLESLGTLQRAVMETVWKLGEATVHDVRDRLLRKEPLAYTTVLSAMQKLEKLGWLRHRRERRTYVYKATRTRKQAGAHSLRKFTRHVFGGNPLLLFESLLEAEELSEQELAALRRQIDAKRKELRDG